MDYPRFDMSKRTKINHTKALKYFKKCVVSFQKDFTQEEITEKKFEVGYEDIAYFEELRKVCENEKLKVKVKQGVMLADVSRDDTGLISLLLYLKFFPESNRKQETPRKKTT